MKIRKLSPLVIITILGIIIGGIVGAQSGWFNFIYDPGGLDVDDTYMESNLTIRELPYWFSADVLVIGSGFSGQEHTVSVSIYQDRPSNGAPWYADGSYSLDLKLLGTIIEPITSGSFTNLATSNPFTTIYLWTPISLPNNYTIALNITDITWSETITVSAKAVLDLESRVSVTVYEGVESVYEYDGQGMVVTIGGTHVRDFLGFANQTNDATANIALSNDATPLISWTKLPGEMKTNGLTRMPGAVTAINATAFQVTRNFTALGPHNVQSIGLHWNALTESEDNLFAAASIDPVILDVDDILEVTWIVNVPDGIDHMVTIGSTHVRNFLGFANQTNVACMYLSLSNDAAPQPDWTKLPNEITANGFDREWGVATVVNGTAYQVTYTWTATAAQSVQATGLHWDVTDDSDTNMLAAAAISAVSLQATDSLQVTWTVNIPDG